MAPLAPKVFDFGERVGLVFIVEAACLSAGSILGLLVYIWWKTLPGILNRRPGHADLYFFSLLVSDFIQAVGAIMDIKWALEAHISEGAFCITQGALKQLGDTGVAFSSMAIAVDTFAILFFRWHRPESRLIPFVVLAIVWCFILLAVAVPYILYRDYYSNTEYWCWIGGNYLNERLGLEYVWMWACSLALIILYFLLFFRLRGNLVVKGWHMHWRRLGKIPAWVIEVEAPGAAHARTMLWYPIVYFITVFPIAVVRWTSFSRPEPWDAIPFAATAFAAILFSLSGFFNVVLFTLTRPGLIPSRKGHSRSQAESTTAAGLDDDEDETRSVRPSIIDQLESFGAVDDPRVINAVDLESGRIRLQRSITTQGSDTFVHFPSNSAEAIQSLSLTLSGDSQRSLTARVPDRPPQIPLP